MSDPARRIRRLLTELSTAIDRIGFDAGRDAITAWEDGCDESDDPPAAFAVLAAGLRHTLDIAEDHDSGADTCHIRIDWPNSGRALSFRFGAHGAGETLSPIITTAVANAIRGVE